MFDVSVLAYNIKYYRRHKGLTQSAVAKEIFVRSQSVSKWERGESVPDVEKICALAKILDVSLDDLLGDGFGKESWMIAVDGGGSKSEFLLFNSGGDILRRSVLAGTNPNLCGVNATISILRSGIDEMLRIKPNVKGIFIGSAGFSSGNGKQVKAGLQEIYPKLKIKCASDMCNAVTSVVENGSCIASICGTGGIVFTYDKGEITRVGGGYGGLFEKTGSGYDIGKQAICIALEERDGTGPKSLITELVEKKAGGPVFQHIHEIYRQQFIYSYIASFAPLVFEAYKQGDEIAKNILNENAERLSFLINRAYKTFHPDDNNVVLTGSLYREETFLRLMREKLHSDLKIVQSDFPPIYGACLLCCLLCGVDPAAIRERFGEQYKKIYGKED